MGRGAHAARIGDATRMQRARITSAIAGNMTGVGFIGGIGLISRIRIIGCIGGIGRISQPAPRTAFTQSP
ncbi:hypothetical protein KTE49_22645 [Burkholderia multivorans]|uniref:hypothetical protein n=1 Tax=Burkholderia multivorans TaxID=87883 RepID=UPI000CFE4A66|nr:hypothetical protein [Burkholderia multivorans]MBJ9615216.1 hypothetical protein [Burkholderia multivorans]MBU9330275.1 hypothetical protein [Burkholderia multivorans]MBU9533239.1 hypothetical protein [Burkholderia multivorans]PRE95648.1 hypothetical protein C6Q01_30555 [Burkholderia multivorans]PRF84373.1 hypothetical protein C6Q23_30625 [Burkholderia multivorans]